MFDRNMFSNIIDVTVDPIAGFTCEGVEEKVWIEHNGKEYLYKIDCKNKLGFTELLFSHLGQKVGYDCVNCYPAIRDNTKGVIVESYLTKEIINVISLQDYVNKYDPFYFGNDEYSLEEIIKQEKKLNKNGLYFAPDFLDKFREMVLVDCILGNIDRHFKNVEFLAYKGEDGKKYITLAPMYDNGRMLSQATFSVRNWNKNYDYKGNDYACMESQFLTIDLRHKFDLFSANKKNVYTIYSIVKEMERNPKLVQLYEKFKKLDIEKEIRYVDQVSNYNLSEKNIKFMVDYFKERLRLIESMLVQYKTTSPKIKNKIQKKSTRIFAKSGYYNKNIDEIEKRLVNGLVQEQFGSGLRENNCHEAKYSKLQNLSMEDTQIDNKQIKQQGNEEEINKG